ncbi:DUF308 domain-containing protein [Bacillus marinisedimentorum]|uniref:DUF308 domain-containing protein n=1 Tax=Bacillus marinisedimentorum TaxID=1821260 RepID=UPI000D0888BA
MPGRMEEQGDALYYGGQGEVSERLASDDYSEETAGEVAVPVADTAGTGAFRQRNEAEETRRNGEGGLEGNNEAANEGRGVGYAALALSIISLFVFPVLMGAAGIIVGFVARRRGAAALGSWAIGIGIASLAISLFFAPFF